MNINDINTAPLSPLFSGAAQPADIKAAISHPLSFCGFTIENNGANEDTTLRDYQAIRYITPLHWKKNTQDGRYYPLSDYSAEINRTTALTPPGDAVNLPPQLETSLIVLQNGTTHLSWENSVTLENKIKDAERQTLYALEKQPKELAEMLSASLITKPVTITAVSPQHLQSENTITIRSYRDIQSIRDMAWVKEKNAYTPLQHYNADLTTKTEVQAAHKQNDPRDYLPETVVTMEDGRQFLCWESARTLQDRLETAERESLHRLHKFIQGLAMNNAPVPQPQREELPEKKRAMVATLEA